MWAWPDLVVTQAGLEGDGGTAAWAMKVEDRMTGRSFEAKPFRLTEDAVNVFQLLTDGEPPRT